MWLQISSLRSLPIVIAEDEPLISTALVAELEHFGAVAVGAVVSLQNAFRPRRNDGTIRRQPCWPHDSGTCSTRYLSWRARPESPRNHDRRHPPLGPSDGGQPVKGGAPPRRIGRTKGGLNSKLPAVCDGLDRPIMVLLSEGRMSDHKGAVLLFPALPRASELLGQGLRE